MQKLDRKGKILVSVGIILVIIGISQFIFAGNFGSNIRSSTILHYIIFSFLPTAIGLALVILPIIKQKRKLKSDFEKKENNLSTQKIKNSQNEDKSTTTDSEKSRKCKVCETNIPLNEKICPGCGDVYS